MESIKNESNNSSFENLIKKYEEELNAIKSDYEQNKEKIRQELYQTLVEKQESVIEIKRAKKQNKTLRKLCYCIKRLTNKIKQCFGNTIKSRKVRILFLVLFAIFSLWLVYCKFMSNNETKTEGSPEVETITEKTGYDKTDKKSETVY